MDQQVSQEEALHRPSKAEIKSTWRAIYADPLVSQSTLKTQAISKQGLGDVSEDGGLTLRSVYWRHYHNLLPSPTSLDQFADVLYSTRQSYARLRKRYLLAPDGRWASDCSPPLPDHLDSPGAGPSRPTSPGTKEWDPLSLESESPWKTWFAHQELRGTIRQDVDRTFPDIPYFESERVRKCMVSILFLYSILNPDVGYRQGMHELLAVCFWAIDRDSILPENDGLKSPLARDAMDDAMRATLDRRYVEHDAYGLFAEIMKSAKTFYEWRAEEGSRSANSTAQAPVITRCQHIHNNLIARIDPQLWERLETEGVEAQIWAIRWLRLIFTRELPFGLALRIWDGVFAEDPGLGLLDFLCVAMLLLIRNELIEADYPTLLTQLLHYPAPSPTYPFDPSLILSQAIFLRGNVSPASGVEIVLQNQDLLGIKAQPPERNRDEEPVRIRGQRPSRGRLSQPQAQQRGVGVQGFAQGWIDRAQAAGLDKAVLSAVSDIRRNLPDTSSAYSYLPNLPFSPLTAPTRDGQFSSIPTSATALPNRLTPNNNHLPRPISSTNPTYYPSEVSTLQAQIRDQERQMAELRLAMLGMGKAMVGYLSESNKEGLERVKDGLLGAGGGDLEELVKEWAWHEGLERSTKNGHGVSVNPSTPAPISQEGPKVISTMGTLNTPRAYPSPVPSPSPIPAKPPLTLSSRTDSGPLTSLPRVPQTAPLSRPDPQSRPTTGVSSPVASKEADPLGNMGFSPRMDNRKQQTKSTSSDPLGAGPL